jgi:hypothetical protein
MAQRKDCFAGITLEERATGDALNVSFLLHFKKRHFKEAKWTAFLAIAISLDVILR